MRKIWKSFVKFCIKITKAYTLCGVCLHEGMVIETRSGYWEIVRYSRFNMAAVNFSPYIKTLPIDVFILRTEENDVLAIYYDLVDCSMSAHPALYRK